MVFLKWKPHMGAIAYSATSLATGLMHPVFQFYYVKIFLDRYNIQSNWFQAVQIVYMIWNAVNDPLFGYCQDNCKLAIVRSRRHAMLFGGPFFALSFLLFWFPWNEYWKTDWLCGMHLLTALCFYDAMFTYVLLAHGCIMAEMTNIHEDRLRMLQYSNVAFLIGSFSVFLCESFSSHLHNYFNFQLTVVILAIFAWMALTYTGKNAHTMYDIKEMAKSNDSTSFIRSTDEGIFKLTWQILSNVNFTWFVIMNFLTEIHRSFGVNFCIIITDSIVNKDIMQVILWNMFYGSVVMLPKILTTLYRPVLSKFGYYDVHRYIFVTKVFAGVLMYFIGSQFQGLFILFVLVDGTLSSVAASMMGLVMTDIIDSDQKIYKRNHPLSSMVFGTNALVTKPAQSIAPIITVGILNSYGYQQYKEGTLEDASSLKDCMFTMACVMPVIIGVAQVIAWSQYKIRNTHIVSVKYVEM